MLLQAGPAPASRLAQRYWHAMPVLAHVSHMLHCLDVQTYKETT